MLPASVLALGNGRTPASALPPSFDVAPGGIDVRTRCGRLSRRPCGRRRLKSRGQPRERRGRQRRCGSSRRPAKLRGQAAVCGQGGCHALCPRGRHHLRCPDFDATIPCGCHEGPAAEACTEHGASVASQSAEQLGFHEVPHADAVVLGPADDHRVRRIQGALHLEALVDVPAVGRQYVASVPLQQPDIVVQSRHQHARPVLGEAHGAHRLQQRVHNELTLAHVVAPDRPVRAARHDLVPGHGDAEHRVRGLGQRLHRTSGAGAEVPDAHRLVVGGTQHHILVRAERQRVDLSVVADELSDHLRGGHVPLEEVLVPATRNELRVILADDNVCHLVVVRTLVGLHVRTGVRIPKSQSLVL
mmetsp:Transcript_82411/g.236807  ORF Transcript_82411/g.236807 Transcript_82411/m.236807 type:complete len:359 (-) Transcript_82411:178-1254(-)